MYQLAKERDELRLSDLDAIPVLLLLQYPACLGIDGPDTVFLIIFPITLAAHLVLFYIIILRSRFDQKASDGIDPFLDDIFHAGRICQIPKGKYPKDKKENAIGNPKSLELFEVYDGCQNAQDEQTIHSNLNGRYKEGQWTLHSLDSVQIKAWNGDEVYHHYE